jgi:hypothetical protein
MVKNKKDYRAGVLEGLKMAMDELRKYYDRTENGLWFEIRVRDIKADYYMITDTPKDYNVDC